MNELANTLRMYAGSNHYDDKCADAMSEAADRLEELEDCDTTCREVYKALDGVPYKGSYADGIETLIKGLATEHARVVGLEKERDSLVSALDTETVVTCLGTYSSGQDPRNALNKLMAWSESVGAYFAQDRLEELEKERDKLILAVADHVTARCELAAQNVAMREALNTVLDAVIALEVEQSDYLLRSSVVLKATDALALPDLASEVLKRRDAEVLRRAADRLQGEFYEHAAADVLRMVADIEG